jgi:hypothetical protein
MKVCAFDVMPACCDSWEPACDLVAQELCTCCPRQAPGFCADEVVLCDCCQAHPGLTGCNCESCESWLCAIDPYCCDVAWDSICAGEAMSLCTCCFGPDGCTDALGAQAQTQAPAPPSVPGAAGGEFFVLDGIDSAIFKGDLTQVPATVLLTDLPFENWGGLSPSDQVGRFFLSKGAPDPKLLRVFEVTGGIESEIPLDRSLATIAFDPGRGTAWGISPPVDGGRLYTIDLDSGTTTLVGDPGVNSFVSALAYDPVTDALLAAFSSDVVYSIDPTSGASRVVGPSGPGLVSGLAWNPVDDQIYGLLVTDFGTGIAVISRSDGAATPVNGPLSNLVLGVGLVFSAAGTPVPATSAWTLVALAVSLLVASCALCRMRIAIRDR